MSRSLSSGRPKAGPVGSSRLPSSMMRPPQRCASGPLVRRIVARRQGLLREQFSAPQPSLSHAPPGLLVLGLAGELGHQLAFGGMLQKFFGRAHRGYDSLSDAPDPRRQNTELIDWSKWLLEYLLSGKGDASRQRPPVLAGTGHSHHRNRAADSAVERQSKRRGRQLRRPSIQCLIANSATTKHNSNKPIKARWVSIRVLRHIEKAPAVSLEAGAKTLGGHHITRSSPKKRRAENLGEREALSGWSMIRIKLNRSLSPIIPEQNGPLSD
jgi:hypothetical protein